MALIRPRQSDMTVFLRMLYLRTEQDLLKELNRLRENGFVEYGTYASLMRVQAILQEMQDESFQYVPQAINKVFNETNKRLGYKAAEALSVPQTAIAEQLAGNLLGNINEAAETAFRTSERIMQIGRLHPDAFRNPTIEASLFREAGGVGETAVEKALKTFNTQNVTSFVDKSGREWGLTEYCTMATRTVSKQAVVAAELTADDWDLWKIIGSGSSCMVCAAYQGRVYSKSGTNPDYPPLATAFGKIDPAGGNDLSNTYLNLHPNCLCSLVRYTTAGRTEKEIQRDKDFSSFEKRPANVDYRTKRQVKEYREKERKRAEFLETRRQWNEYRERLGDKIPSLETFEKHKKAGDDKYKEWMSAYRKKGAEIRKSLPKPEPIPVEPVIPPTPKPPVKQISSPAEVKDALLADVGFTDMSSDVMGLNKSLMVDTTNQLLSLEDKFGVIHSGRCSIVAINDGGATAAVFPGGGVTTNNQDLTLCPSWYKNRKKLVETFETRSRLDRQGRPGYFMPMEQGKAAIYPVTHEYGHMVQFRLMQERLTQKGIIIDRASFRAMSPKQREEQLKRIETGKKDVARDCREEILGIAKSRNPNFQVDMNISSYGQSDDYEFFAECFANSQLGAPNELGEAMAIWLERNGQLR